MTKTQSKKIKEFMKVLKAVKLKCLECSSYSIYEVKICHLNSCALFPYRTGVLNYSPKITREKSRIKQKNAVVEVQSILK